VTDGQLQRLQEMIGPLQDALPSGVSVDCLHFFSGAAAYANSSIFATLTPVGLALRLPDEAGRELVEIGGKVLRHYPVGPMKKEYVVVPDYLADDPAQLRVWALQAVDHALEEEG
jgi:hypothetical protein